MICRVVVIVSAGAEWRAIRPLFSGARIERSPFGEWFTDDVSTDGGEMPTAFLHGGWGKIAAAASTQWAIDRWRPALMINLGTCGGFAGKTARGTIILATRTVVYDIVERMGDQEEALRRYATDLEPDRLAGAAIEAAYPGVVRGTLASADRDLSPADVAMLQECGAAGADWESGAIAWVAARNGVPCIVLRGVSDLVGPTGGEADGDYALFADRASDVMRTLVSGLPAWIGRAAALAGREEPA